MLRYTKSDCDKTPDGIETATLAQVQFGEGWELRNNIIFEFEVGYNAKNGAAFELCNQLMKSIESFEPFKKFAIGIEMFNDVGKLDNLNGYETQDHQFGPVIKGSFENSLFFEIGYRSGIAEGAIDNVFNIVIGKKF